MSNVNFENSLMDPYDGSNGSHGLNLEGQSKHIQTISLLFAFNHPKIYTNIRNKI